MARPRLRFESCREAKAAGNHSWYDFNLLFPCAPCAKHPLTEFFKACME